MAKRSDRSAASSSGGSRRRTVAAPVKKPFPWGTVTVSAVLSVLLLGILVYAAQNQGAGFVNPLTAADKSVHGVKVSGRQTQQHTTSAVTYDKTPPVGGKHNPVPQTCQVYTQPIANEHAVHSMEHGAVWVTYRPDLAAGELSALTALVQGNPYRLMSPFPELKSPISLQAWGRQLSVDKASDPRVQAFLDAYTSGPQAPERGSACAGTTATGPLAAAQAPAPSSSAAPSAASTALTPSPSVSPSR